MTDDEKKSENERKNPTGSWQRIVMGRLDNNDVSTPVALYNKLDAMYNFTFDPCPLHATFNGLEMDWGTSNFVNPPFNDVDLWAKKAVEELSKNRLSILLIPYRGNSRYWRDYIWPYATNITFLDKGIRFGGYKKVFPIPMVIVEMNPEAKTRYHKRLGWSLE